MILRAKLISPDKEWMKRLDERGFTANSVFDKGQHEELKRKLLDIAGVAVCLPVIEEDKHKILNRGKVWRGYKAVHMSRYYDNMEQSHCHSNTSAIWRHSKGKWSCCTGYALSKQDSLWRQHSWVIKNNLPDYIVGETTEKRILYYGYVMTEDEAEDFYWSN